MLFNEEFLCAMMEFPENLGCQLSVVSCQLSVVIGCQ